MSSVDLSRPSLDSLAVHLRQAVADATLLTDPGPHMVISDMLPAETYTFLLETMPPPEAFDVADRVKAKFDPVRTTSAPERSREAWLWFHTDVVDRLLTPILLDAFRPSLAVAYQALFGPTHAGDALGLDHRAFADD